MGLLIRTIPLAWLLLAAGCVGTDTASKAPSLAEIHHRALVLDAHTDIEIPGAESRYVGADGLSKVAVDKMQRGDVDVVVMAIAVGPMPRTPEGYQTARQKAQSELEAVQAMTGPAGDMTLITSSDQLAAAATGGRPGAILGFQNALILGENIAGLDEFYESGVRLFALTHMGHNAFADSSRPLFVAASGDHEPEAEHGGLSALGRAAITRINELGAVVDISQLSRDAALQAIELSSAPVIASHSNVRALTDVSRNLSDAEIDLIGKTGGVIHVAPFRGYLFDSTDASLDGKIRAARRTAGIKEDSYYPFELYWEIDDPAVQREFLDTVSGLLGPGSIDAMLNHIDYIVARIGVDHVGIGTDFNHGSGLKGFDDASEAQNVTAALLARGYSEADVQKIWGGNFLRVFRQAESQANP